MSEEDIRAVAVEAVRVHLEDIETRRSISDKSKLQTSVRNAFAICITIILATSGGTWAVAQRLNSIQNAQDRIEAGLNYKVGVGQFRAWAAQLDRMNRTSVPGLFVPEAPEAAVSASAPAARPPNQ